MTGDAVPTKAQTAGRNSGRARVLQIDRVILGRGVSMNGKSVESARQRRSMAHSVCRRGVWQTGMQYPARTHHRRPQSRIAARAERGLKAFSQQSPHPAATMPKLRTCGASVPALPGRRGRASGCRVQVRWCSAPQSPGCRLAVGVAGAAIPHREVIGIAADRRVRKVAQPVLCQRQRGDFVCIRCGGPLHASSRQCLVVKQFPERDLECRGLDLVVRGPLRRSADRKGPGRPAIASHR